MIPTSSNYPENFDTDTNLFLVHDSLRVRLIDDYNPGDTSITIEGDLARFPDTGLITLTEQCSDLDKRAISFFYGSKTDTTFNQLEILPNFQDVVKPKLITNVTQNVMAKHHNHLKNALIAIEEFLGIKGTIDSRPFGKTLEGRLNFIRKLVLAPKAWFEANKTIGIIPLTVQFKDKSFRTPTKWQWNFGDGGNPSTVICVDEVVSGIHNPVIDNDGGTITKTYTVPSSYDVTLTVSNEFGEDEVTFPNFIIARVAAPDEATITVNPSKAKINTLINIEATNDGEQQDGFSNPIDAINEYTWELSDDLTHNSSPTTTAMYSIGGFYDVQLRTDTELGAYRITNLENALNIVESVNLWLLTFNSPSTNLSVTKTASTYEFGLISETFKTATMPQAITRDHTFIDGTYSQVEYQRALFRNNNSIAQKNTATSGNNGSAYIYWAEDDATIKFKEFKPFDETWVSPSIGGVGDSIIRNWNWVGLNSPADINIVFGLDTVEPNPADVSQDKDRISLYSLAVSSSVLNGTNYINGADELEINPNAYPSTCKSTWHISNGYILRNEAGPGGFFRLRNFYKTEGIMSEFVQNFRKLPDIPGSVKLEGELTSLNGGVFFFNNSGEISVFDTNTNTWSGASPGVGSSPFRSLQDATVSGSGDLDQPLKLTSDKDRRAYLSFEYSTKAFIKFNEADLTFTTLPIRPEGEQFIMGVY